MRNRCPGATAQPASASEDATPSSLETRIQQVSPDRPLAVMPCSRRAERLGHRAEGDPARQSGRRRAGGHARDRPGVVVLDQPGRRVAAQDRADRGRAIGVPGGAGGGLSPRGGDHRARAPGQRGRELSGPQTQVVHRHRHRGIAHGRDQVEGHRVAGILDDDPVRGVQPGREDALDAVQRAAGDHEAARVDAVGGQLLGGQPSQPRRDRGLRVHPARPHRWPGRQVGQQVRIGATGDEVASARRNGQVPAAADRGSAPDPGAGPARARGDTPPAQLAVGGGDRGRTDPQLVG
jgi:hypothetical protein